MSLDNLNMEDAIPFAMPSSVVQHHLPCHEKNCKQEDFHKSRENVGETFLHSSSTNSYAENYFTFLKNSLKEIPMEVDRFIETHWNNVKGLCRQYIDGMCSSLSSKPDKRQPTKMWSESKLEKLEASLDRSSTCEMIDDDISEVEVETWIETTPKRASNTSKLSGIYQEPPKTPFSTFNPLQKQAKVKRDQTKTDKKRESMQLQPFKQEVWDTIASCQEDPDLIFQKVKTQYNPLTKEEKEKLNTPRHQEKTTYCICKRSYSNTDPMMVQCDICKEWLHHTFIGFDYYFLDIVPKFHCLNCIEEDTQTFSNFLLYYDTSFDDYNVNLVGNIFKVWKSLPQEHKVCASLNKYPLLELAKQGILPKCESLKGIDNPRQNC